MKRIVVSRWTSDRSFDLIHPMGKKKRVTTWLASLEFEDSLWVHEKILSERPGFGCGCDLIKIAHCVGSYARLWIGSLDGVIAPMDIPPEGWTYPSGTPAEAPWFWQWIPSEVSQRHLMEEIRQTDPVLKPPTHLKRLVPFQLNRKYGKDGLQSIEGIDLNRLPDLFPPKTEFVFETEQDCANF